TVFTPTVAVAQQNVLKLRTRDLAGTKARQVFGRYLTVDKVIAPALQLSAQGDGGNLRGIGLQAEHGLAEEQVAGGDAVEPAYQLALAPHFDGMGNLQLVHAAIGLLHVIGDPGGGAFRTPGRAIGDDLGKGAIEGYLEFALAQQFAHAARDHELLRKQPHAYRRRPPQNGFAFLVPGKDAEGVCLYQPGRTEVAAHGQQAVGILQGLLDWRKSRRVFVQPGDRDHGAAILLLSCNDLLPFAYWSRNFSASRAAIQPNPAEVMAWR